jgi:hypothetical protein
MKSLTFKKLANHWYPEIPHDFLDEIKLSEKIEKWLSFLDKDRDGTVIITLYDQNCYIEDSTLQFGDDSLCRYFTTNDEFDLDFWIGERKFTISATLYTILENQFQFNFHDTTYNILLSQ